MKYEDVKKTAEQMACKIFEYIHATDLSPDKKDKIFYSISASFLTSGIHENDYSKAIRKIREVSRDISLLAESGYLKFLFGDLEEERILKDLSD